MRRRARGATGRRPCSGRRGRCVPSRRSFRTRPGSRRTATARTASLRSAAPRAAAARAPPARRSSAPRSRGAAPRRPRLDAASWRLPRWRAGVDADHEGLDACRETGSRGLDRGVTAVGGVRLRGGDALLKAGAGVRSVARGDGGGARRGAGRERRLKHRLRRRLAGEAGVTTVLNARDVAVDAAARRDLEDQLAIGEYRPECRLSLRLAHTRSARGPSPCRASVRALVEPAVTLDQRPSETPHHVVVAAEVRDLRLADAAGALHARPLRHEGKLGLTLRHVGLELHVALRELRCRAGQIATVPPLRPARLDTLVLALDTAAHRILERSRRARRALPVVASGGRQTGVMAREHRRLPDRGSGSDREDHQHHATGATPKRRRYLSTVRSTVWHGHAAYRRPSGLAAKQVDVPSWHMTTYVVRWLHPATPTVYSTRCSPPTQGPWIAGWM